MLTYIRSKHFWMQYLWPTQVCERLYSIVNNRANSVMLSRLTRASVFRAHASTVSLRRALPLYVRAFSGDSKGQCSGSCNCNCSTTLPQGAQRAKLLNGEALVEASQALSLMKVGGGNVRFLDATWHLDKARNGNQEYIAEVT
jgi:hypothetical protein